MFAANSRLERVDPASTAALAVALGGTAAILGAYFFQYVIGLPPCPLCLDQRIPYYIAIPLAVLIAIASIRHAPRGLLAGGLVVLAVIMIVGAGLGVYHAGIEWKLWAGPQDCSGPMNPLGGGGGLLRQLEETRVVRCDEAAWRFLGLSLAGWNVLISLALAAVATWGGNETLRRVSPQGSSSVSQ